MRYIVRTLGCKANVYDSQLLEAELQRRGWRAWNKYECQKGEGGEDGGAVRLCIINSCTVTDEADRQSRKLAARLAREHEGAAIVVTGCAAEVDPELLAKSRGIHYVIGNRDKLRLVSMILEKLGAAGEVSTAEGAELLGRTESYAEMASRHPLERDWPLPETAFQLPPAALRGNTSKTRAFLKIQEGCNSFCTYCVIPYGRGPSRSLAPEAVLSQVRALCEEGVRELVITGTNIGDYGTDLDGEPLLERLLMRILGETPLERLRVSSLDPTEITPGILKLAAEDGRFCPHFHVSLQSPDDRVLRQMKRRYGSREVRSCLEAIAALPVARGGAFVAMDVIAGFPGESDAQFEEGVRLLETLPWSRLHVFPYSEREGTPATRLPGAVPRHERVRRAQRLQELSLRRLQRFNEAALAGAGRWDDILVELTPRGPRGERDGRWVSGYTSNYLRVYADARGLAEQSIPRRNSYVSVRPADLVVDPQAGDVVLVGQLL